MSIKVIIRKDDADKMLQLCEQGLCRVTKQIVDNKPELILSPRSGGGSL